MKDLYVETLYKTEQELISAIDSWLRWALYKIPHVENVEQVRRGEHEVIIFSEKIKIKWQFL